MFHNLSFEESNGFPAVRLTAERSYAGTMAASHPIPGFFSGCSLKGGWEWGYGVRMAKRGVGPADLTQSRVSSVVVVYREVGGGMGLGRQSEGW